MQHRHSLGSCDFDPCRNSRQLGKDTAADVSDTPAAAAAAAATAATMPAETVGATAAAFGSAAEALRGAVTAAGTAGGHSGDGGGPAESRSDGEASSLAGTHASSGGTVSASIPSLDAHPIAQNRLVCLLPLQVLQAGGVHSSHLQTESTLSVDRSGLITAPPHSHGGAPPLHKQSETPMARHMKALVRVRCTSSCLRGFSCLVNGTDMSTAASRNVPTAVLPM